MKPINDLLKMAAQKGASDLHMKVGSQPVMRLNGALVELAEGERIGVEDVIKVCKSVMNPNQLENFKKNNDLDFAYSVPGLGRFRANAFVQRGAIGFVFRLIPMKIPSFEELGLPGAVAKLALSERGMILVTGTTGSGKSTTLASMIDYINQNKTSNIITIEDPIEYLHRDKRSLINQREVGSDTRAFNVSLRSALRQDPDVILVGEMRDPETIETAMSAAETGHLVMSTLHTTDTTETINRIISAFPPHQHKQVRMQLSTILKGVISMRLLPRTDGKGRVPAVEVLLATSIIRDCILDETKTKMIRDYIEKGKLHYGMQTFDQCLLDLYQGGKVTYDEALKSATNVEDFKLKVKGVTSGSEDEDKLDLSTGEGDDDDLKIDRF
jgi:twitching motility protein PilT